MKRKNRQVGMMKRLVSKRVWDKNASALRYYDNYRKVADIIERVERAAGMRVVFKSDAGSALNLEVALHGPYSTTAHKI